VVVGPLEIDSLTAVKLVKDVSSNLSTESKDDVERTGWRSRCGGNAQRPRSCLTHAPCSQAVSTSGVGSVQRHRSEKQA
jgi:hypothetical protein